MQEMTELERLMHRMKLMERSLSIYKKVIEYEQENKTESGSEEIAKYIDLSIRLDNAGLKFSNMPLNIIIEGNWDSQYEKYFCKQFTPFV